MVKVFPLGNIEFGWVLVWHWNWSLPLMFTFIFQWKSFHLFPPPLVKKFFEKFSPRFLFSKSMADIIFFNSESSSRPIPDIFYFIWEVFLIDFLSKMESQKAWNSFGMILNWWNFGLHWIKFCILPCCELLVCCSFSSFKIVPLQNQN